MQNNGASNNKPCASANGNGTPAQKKPANNSAVTLRRYFRIYKPGAVLIEEDVPPKVFYILYSGKVRQYGKNVNSKCYNKRGDCFGAIPTFVQKPSSYQIETDTYCLIQAIPRADIPKLVSNSPEMGLHLLLLLAEAGYGAEQTAMEKQTEHKKLAKTIEREISILKNLIQETTAKYNHPALKALLMFIENSPMVKGHDEKVKVDHVSLDNLLQQLDASERLARG